MIDAKHRYGIHKGTAKARGVEFKLNFEDWNNWWLAHGVDKNYPTAKGPNVLCMCRTNDSGAYELSNIYCDTLSNNIKHSYSLRHSKNTYSNGRQRVVKTPVGTFNSIKVASVALGVSGNTIRTRVRNNVEGYSFDIRQ